MSIDGPFLVFSQVINPARRSAVPVAKTRPVLLFKIHTAAAVLVGVSEPAAPLTLNANRPTASARINVVLIHPAMWDLAVIAHRTQHVLRLLTHTAEVVHVEVWGQAAPWGHSVNRPTASARINAVLIHPAMRDLAVTAHKTQHVLRLLTHTAEVVHVGVWGQAAP